MLGYELDALPLIIGGGIDLGISALRMAYELARDTAIMDGDEAKCDLWHKREEPEQQKRYRQAFAFDKRDPLLYKMYKSYKVCCRFGTHGHTTAAAAGGPLRPGPTPEFVIWGVRHSQVLGWLPLWLTAFAETNLVIVQAVKRHPRDPMGVTARALSVLLSTIAGLDTAWQYLSRLEKEHTPEEVDEWWNSDDGIEWPPDA